MLPKVIIFADIYDSFQEFNSILKQEWESKKSIDYLIEIIQSLNYEVQLIEPLKANFLNKINFAIETIFFNLCEGFESRNRESYIPNLAEFFGCAYTGSDSYAINISIDKSLTKDIVKKNNIPTKKYLKINSFDEIDFKYPAFIKPNLEGSSLGIDSKNIIQNKFELNQKIKELLPIYNELILEEYLSGDDLTIGVIGNYPDYKTTKVARIKYPNKIYDSKTKSKSEMPEKLFFNIDTNLEKKIALDSILLAKELKIDGFARIDYKLDERNNPFFLEINLTPGISKFYSSFPICYEASFGNYTELIQEILNLAVINFKKNSKFNYGKLIKK